MMDKVCTVYNDHLKYCIEMKVLASYYRQAVFLSLKDIVKSAI